MNTDEHTPIDESPDEDCGAPAAEPIGESSGSPARACRRCAVISHTDAASCPACGASYASRDIRTPLIRAAVVAAVAIPLIAGAFLLGQSTRITEEEAARREAVTAAALTKRHKQKTHNLLVRQEKKLKKVFNKRAKKRAEKAYKSGQSAGYSAGHSAGYDSGYDQGGSDGVDAGIDLGACLADPYYC